VAADLPRLLYQDTQLYIVEKPAGLPALAGVGPGVAGENNAAALLNRDRRRGGINGKNLWSTNGSGDEDDAELFAVNRIDKPVSGVWIMAKGSRLSARVRAALARPGGETKTYLARVAGRFPAAGILVDAPLRVGQDGRAAVGGQGAKDAATHFYPLAVVDVGRARVNDGDGDDVSASYTGGGRFETLVAARLTHSGRFHQIRAHLAHAGYPIVNDTSYNGGKGACCEQKVDSDNGRRGGGGEGEGGDGRRSAGDGGKGGGGGGDGGGGSGVGVSDRGDGGSGGFPLYLDDDVGSLRAMAVASHQPWCLECGWTLAAIAGDPRAFHREDKNDAAGITPGGIRSPISDHLAKRNPHAPSDGSDSGSGGLALGGGSGGRGIPLNSGGHLSTSQPISEESGKLRAALDALRHHATGSREPFPGDACADARINPGEQSRTVAVDLRPVAGQRIDLHSLEYRFTFDGRAFHVQSAALPPFAVDALLRGQPVGDPSSSLIPGVDSGLSFDSGSDQGVSLNDSNSGASAVDPAIHRSATQAIVGGQIKSSPRGLTDVASVLASLPWALESDAGGRGGRSVTHSKPLTCIDQRKSETLDPHY